MNKKAHQTHPSPFEAQVQEVHSRPASAPHARLVQKTSGLLTPHQLAKHGVPQRASGPHCYIEGSYTGQLRKGAAHERRRNIYRGRHRPTTDAYQIGWRFCASQTGGCTHHRHGADPSGCRSSRGHTNDRDASTGFACQQPGSAGGHVCPLGRSSEHDTDSSKPDETLTSNGSGTTSNPLRRIDLHQIRPNILPIIWTQALATDSAAAFTLDKVAKFFAEGLTDRHRLSKVSDRGSDAPGKRCLVVNRQLAQVGSKFIHAITLPFGDIQCNTIWCFTIQ